MDEPTLACTPIISLTATYASSNTIITSASSTALIWWIRNDEYEPHELKYSIVDGSIELNSSPAITAVYANAINHGKYDGITRSFLKSIANVNALTNAANDVNDAEHDVSEYSTQCTVATSLATAVTLVIEKGQSLR